MIELESFIDIPTPLVQLKDELFIENEVEVYVKRDDLTHSFVSGNKFRKLQYNFKKAENKQYTKILTFGGAYSNHIAAVAYAAKALGFESKAIIRGDELSENSSPTLSFCAEQGMEFQFVSRTAYRDKNLFISDQTFYCIPEGGSNFLALEGVSEMVDEIQNEISNVDYIALAMGTGGTVAGVLSNPNFRGRAIGVSVLKNGAFLLDDIKKLDANLDLDRFDFWGGYDFGGYAKTTSELLSFMYEFESKHGFLIEQVYTAKLFYGIYDKIKNGYFKKGTKIVVIHTGGIQGRTKKTE